MNSVRPATVHGILIRTHALLCGEPGMVCRHGQKAGVCASLHDETSSSCRPLVRHPAEREFDPLHFFPRRGKS